MSYFECLGSGEVSASAEIDDGRCYLTSLMIYTDGVHDATVTLYDNTAASGTVIAKMIVVATENYSGRIWTFPRICNIGIYAKIEGTGANCIVEYIERVPRISS